MDCTSNGNLIDRMKAVGVLMLAMAVALLWALGEAYAAPVNWAQPPVACVEEIVPHPASRACLDLSTVNDPLNDFPTNLSDDELEFWQNNKTATNYCRAREVMAREQKRPGSFSEGAIELSWMRLKAAENSDAKIAAVYGASFVNQMPPQILAGALMQESLFSDLGIAEDGGNFSCGIGQVNLIEWCRWANNQDPKKKLQMNWPDTGVACGSLQPSFIKPFYEIAKKKLSGLPEYRLEKSHFTGIRQQDVDHDFPAGTSDEHRLWFQLATSFIQNCSDTANGVAAKANELRSLYNNFIPQTLKERDMYPIGQSYGRQCSASGGVASRAYPLHTGWLLAVGLYNSGPRSMDALAHYYGWDTAQMNNPASWKGIGPAELIQAFYWTGKYNPANDKIEFSTLGQGSISWIWYKPCVLQRHIARVVQHVTLAGTPKLVESLEGQYKCAKSQFDPGTGALLKSAVPSFRQKSSGQKRRP